MNRRSLFKGVAALLGAAAIGPAALAREYATGGDFGPNARFRMTARSDLGGRTGIGVETRVLEDNNSSAWRSASWYLDVPEDPTKAPRFIVKANQFHI